VTIQSDGSLLWVVEATEQHGQGGFSGPALTHHRQHLSGANDDREVTQDLCVRARRIGEANLGECELPTGLHLRISIPQDTVGRHAMWIEGRHNRRVCTVNALVRRQEHTYTHTHTCSQICTHASAFSYTHTHTHACAYTHTHTHAHVHSHTCVLTYTLAYTHTRAFTHTHTRAFTHTHAHTRTHMHVHLHWHTYLQPTETHNREVEI
jgi:hypothetical protein